MSNADTSTTWKLLAPWSRNGGILDFYTLEMDIKINATIFRKLRLDVKDLPNKLFVILSSSVIQLSVHVLDGHVLLTGYGGTRRKACFLSQCGRGVWHLPNVVSFGSQPGRGQGMVEKWRAFPQLLISVQYCVPHGCLGIGQGHRNRIRTIFLQVLYFRSPWFIVVECSDVCHLLDNQYPARSFWLETMFENNAFKMTSFTFFSFLWKAGRHQKCPCGCHVLLNYTIIPEIERW